jgi:purine-binding chemotaxis protein CheW
MKSSESRPEAGPPSASSAEQLLTFFVDGDEYGVDILRVQEIRAFSPPMPIPHAPPYIKGVINIRGDVVPIADLRERLHLDAIAESATTAVVVLRTMLAGRQRVMGIVVDAMSDVTNIAVDKVKPPPEFGDSGRTELARGIATLEDKMITILDVDQIFVTPSAASAAVA